MTRLTASDVTIACATPLEARAARRALAGFRIVETGVALRKLREPLGETVISCGLAGGLHHDVPTGTVVIPDEVGRIGGARLACDPVLTEILREAAARLGFPVRTEPLVTTAEIVRGAERRRWMNAGYIAVDMETGLLRVGRVAAIRVVLDTPLRELSEEWLNPARAMLKPRNWSEMLWLARTAPAQARRAALVIRDAFVASREELTGRDK